jgi:hypothetical protein
MTFTISPNLIHNLLNLFLAVLAPLEAFRWTDFLSPSSALAVAGAVATLKLAINIYRDGITGLVKTQPPVVPATPAVQ